MPKANPGLRQAISSNPHRVSPEQPLPKVSSLGILPAFLAVSSPSDITVSRRAPCPDIPTFPAHLWDEGKLSVSPPLDS